VKGWLWLTLADLARAGLGVAMAVAGAWLIRGLVEWAGW
jgi:hypothetical protein